MTNVQDFGLKMRLDTTSLAVHVKDYELNRLTCKKKESDASRNYEGARFFTQARHYEPLRGRTIRGWGPALQVKNDLNNKARK